jgi:hypothetical protein
MLKQFFCSSAHFESRPTVSDPTAATFFWVSPSHLPSGNHVFLHPPRVLFFSPVTSTFHEASLRSQILQACESSRTQALAPAPPRSKHRRLVGIAPLLPRMPADPPLGLKKTDEPLVVDRIDVAHGHMEGDIALSAAVLIDQEPR